MMQYARTDTGQRQLTDIDAFIEEAVQLAHSRRSLDRSFGTIYTEYESAIALSEVAFSEIARAFINILESACYAVFQKQKNWQQGIEPQTESLTSKIMVKTHNLVKAVEISRENSIRIPLEIPENILHPFFTAKPTAEPTGLELSLTGDIIAGLYSGTLKVERETRAYTEFIITLPKL